MKIKLVQSVAGVDFAYGAGTVLEVDVDIPKRRALELLNASHAVPDTDTIETADYPKHIGGGWYQTADGRKVRKSELEA